MRSDTHHQTINCNMQFPYVCKEPAIYWMLKACGNEHMFSIGYCEKHKNNKHALKGIERCCECQVKYLESVTFTLGEHAPHMPIHVLWHHGLS